MKKLKKILKTRALNAYVSMAFIYVVLFIFSLFSLFMIFIKDISYLVNSIDRKLYNLEDVRNKNRR